LINESILIEKINGGDKDAFRQLFEKYTEKIFYLSLNLTGNHQDAEDLSQEVFIKMYKNIQQFKGEASLGSWLYRITVNTFLNTRNKKSFNIIRKSKNLDKVKIWDEALSGAAVSDNPEESTQSVFIQKHINNALHKLSKKERTVFVLRHYNGIPLKEIAQQLNVSTGTVKSTLFRSLKKLQKELSFYKEEILGEGV